MLTIQEFSSKLKGVRAGNGGQISALCPAHEDHQPSLSFRMTDGGFQFKCHAGCNRKDILAAMNLTEGDVWVESGRQVSRSSIESTYPYHDENGRLLFETVRLIPKGFHQRRPATTQDPHDKVKRDSEGHEWVYSLKDSNGNQIRRVLYRLPETLAAIEVGHTIFVVEGEKDVESIVGLGLDATTSPQGAGKWSDEFSVCLKNATRIVVCPDNDPAPTKAPDKGYPGQRHAAAIVRSLLKGGTAPDRIQVLEFPGVKDASDWIAKGGTSDGLIALAHDAPTGLAWLQNWEQRLNGTANFQSGDVSASAGEISDLDLRNTDKGNADRLVATHGHDLLYDGSEWYVWDEHCYALDIRDRRRELAKQVVEANLRDAMAIEDFKDCDQAIRAARRCLQLQRINAMLELAASDPKIRVVPDDLDADRDLLNVINGTIDLRTGTLRPHNRADRITKLAGVAFDPTADCPNFMGFLDLIMGSNPKLVAYLQRFAGSCLSGDARDQIFHVWHGGGSNGKGTLIRAILLVMGDYACQANTETFLEHAAESNGSSHQEDLARLKGIRFVAAEEASPGRKLNIGKIKTMTGGDRIVARMPYGRRSFEFTPQFTLVFATNHEPNVPSADHGTWRRLRQCPFNVTITPEMRDQNPDFEAGLVAESAGILRWAVEGCLAWRKEGIQPPEEVMAATDEWRTDTNPVLRFVNEVCVRGVEHRCKASDIYDAYKTWCMGNDEEPLKQRSFGVKLTELQFRRHRGTNNVHFWIGINVSELSDRMTQGDPYSPDDLYTHANVCAHALE